MKNRKENKDTNTTGAYFHFFQAERDTGVGEGGSIVNREVQI